MTALSAGSGNFDPLRVDEYRGIYMRRRLRVDQEKKHDEALIEDEDGDDVEEIQTKEKCASPTAIEKMSYRAMISGNRQGPPKHQNKFCWKPHCGQKINPTKLNGSSRPNSEINGVCLRCKGQIDWKRKCGQYKPLSELAKWHFASELAQTILYHNRKVNLKEIMIANGLIDEESDLQGITNIWGATF